MPKETRRIAAPNPEPPAVTLEKWAGELRTIADLLADGKFTPESRSLVDRLLTCPPGAEAPRETLPEIYTRTVREGWPLETRSRLREAAGLLGKLLTPERKAKPEETPEQKAERLDAERRATSKRLGEIADGLTPMTMRRLETETATTSNGKGKSARHKTRATFHPEKGILTIGGETFNLEGIEGDVLKALIETSPANLKTLRHVSNNDKPHAILKRLVEKHRPLREHITLPGRRGAGGYRTTIKFTRGTK